HHRRGDRTGRRGRRALHLPGSRGPAAGVTGGRRHPGRRGRGLPGRLPAPERPARPRGLQAPPDRRAGAAGPGRRRGPGPGKGDLMQVTMTVNGSEVTEDVEPRLLLVHFLRDTLGLTGTHWGCDTSNCGACTVWVDGTPLKSCTTLAAMTAGHT